MKRLALLILAINCFAWLQAQDLSYLNKSAYTGVFNQAYGVHERNTFDILLPNNDSTHGLVIFIHGGGFFQGDKSAVYNRKHDIKYFLDHNVAVATINYRFAASNDSLGVKASLNDVQRAIQFFRFNASRYNIDKERLACYGSSAGAGSSLYFAFHDDLALEGDTTLLGESTRLKCVGAMSTQSTYNVFRWKRIIPYMRLVFLLKGKQIKHSAANFYGYQDYKSFKGGKKEISESLDMLSMIDAQDPPIYLMNLLEGNFPKNDNIIQHHRKHAVAVSKMLNKYGVENHLYTSKAVEMEKDISFKLSAFIVKHLQEEKANKLVFTIE